MNLNFRIRPKCLVFFVSFRCNLRCAMCYCWVKGAQENQFSLEEIRKVFDDKAIKDSIEVVNITGGEPTLRGDLDEIARIMTDSCSRLKRIDVSTNGVDTETVTDRLQRLLAVLLPSGIRMTANISIDGPEEVHERVRGSGGIFRKIENTIDELKELMCLYPQFSVGLNMTISRLNVDALEEARTFAASKGLGMHFTLAALSEIGVESVRVKDAFEMNERDKKKVIRFVEDLLDAHYIDKRYGRFLKTWLITGRRIAGCSFRNGNTILLEPDGQVYFCGNYAAFKAGNILREPLEKMFRNRRYFKEAFREKCATCNSNCYLDES